jgi:serine/threonine protein kinase
MDDQGFPEPPDAMIGQSIDRYVIRSRLAEGGMGAVYLASHERLENTLKVIKLLLPIYARNAMLRDRFEREALAVSRLRHRNIITIDNYGQLPDGQMFLMMPFLEGRPLDAYLRDHGKLTEHRALHILVQVCSAVQHMHDAGIVHRDIKPSNIFIISEDDNPCRVMLIDLGIAKSLSERDGVTNTGSQMGTPAYMAVEQYEDAAGVTPLADLYAVAIVIWEMITGRLPWGMHSSHVLYKKQKEEPLSCPPEMSAAWFAILSAALSPHLSVRPESMRALAIALASTVQAIPPHVPSGAEILAKQASTFVQHAPHSAETIRNASNQERIAPMLWPPRETGSSPPSASGGLPPLAVHTVSYQTPLHTARLKPPAGMAAPTSPTTLSALSGAGGTVAPPKTRNARLALAGVGAGAVAALVTFAIARGGGTSERQPGQSPEPGLAHASSVDAAVEPDAAASPSVAIPVDAPTPSDASADATPPDAGQSLVEVPRTPTAKRIPSKVRAVEPARPPVARPGAEASGVEKHRGSGSASTFNPNGVGGDE